MALQLRRPAFEIFTPQPHEGTAVGSWDGLEVVQGVQRPTWSQGHLVLGSVVGDPNRHWGWLLCLLRVHLAGSC
jgi:hypothetical protein